MPSDEPTTEPAHPKPAAAARTAAAGGFFALAAMAIAGVTVALFTAVRLLVSGDERLLVGGPSAIVLALAFAVTTAAALVALTRSWAAPRPVTLILTVAVAMAWPLSGVPIPALAVATLVIALTLARDHRSPGGQRIDGVAVPSLLVVLALGLTVIGAASADTESLQRHTPAADLVPVATPEPAVKKQAEKPERASAKRRGEKPSVLAPADGETPAAGDDDAPAAGAPSGAEQPADDAPSAGAPSGADEPAPRSAARPAADAFVRDYYEALNEQRFEAAWHVLTPAVRARFGGFQHWQDGYGRTISSVPSAFEVAPAAGGGVTVTHLLVARDRGCGGPLRFRVTWRLRADSSTWTVTALSAVAEGAATC